MPSKVRHHPISSSIRKDLSLQDDVNYRLKSLLKLISRSRKIFICNPESLHRFQLKPGCHWKRIQLDDGTFRFKSQSTSGNKSYLDSSTTASSDESVYLTDDSAGDGSHWTPTQLTDGSYSLESKTQSGAKYFLNSDPTAGRANM